MGSSMSPFEKVSLMNGDFSRCSKTFRDKEITVFVIGIGKRERNEAYRKALRRWPPGESGI